MRWFSGNMLQAIAEAHSRRVLLLVFVEGDDLASQNMRSTFEDAEVNKLLDVMGCVPIRLRANSSACRQFTLVYPVTAIPSTFFISSRGNLEASVVGFTDPVSFGDRLAALMASCNLKKVDSDMRNVSEVSVSVDRMVRLNRQSSSARLPVAPPPEGALGTLPLQQIPQQQPPAEGIAKKRSKGGDRRPKKKHKRQEANVQTSIVVLAEQATQINMDDKRSYNSLLQKLAAMEEATSVPTATVATAHVHGDLAGDLALLMGDGKEKKDLDELSENALSGGADFENKGKSPSPDDGKSELSPDTENGANDQARPGSHKAKGKDEINATMPPQPPPPPPPPPAAEAVRASEFEQPVRDVPSAALDDVDPALCEVLADGPALLIKFAVLAQEFADKVLGSSQHEHCDSKSMETSAAETPKASPDVRKLAGTFNKPNAKQEQQGRKFDSSLPAKTVEVHAKRERQRQTGDSFKRTCQLESLQANVGDAPEAIATLQEGALEQAGDKDSKDKRTPSSGARSHKQPRNPEAPQPSQQQSKHGSEKRKKHRDSATKDNAGDSKRTTASFNKVAAKTAAAPGSSTQEQGKGPSQLALKIKHFEAAAANASQDAKAAVLSERKAKRSKSASPSKPSPANDTRARSPENNGLQRTHVQMSAAHPPLPKISLEQDVCVVRMRPGIHTITEEETGAIDSGPTSPRPTPPPLQSPLPPTPEVPTQQEVQKAAEETSQKSSVREPACDVAAPPLALSHPPPSRQTTQATVSPNRNSHHSRKSARRPSSPNKSKEFLTASNSQLDDALVFGPTHRTSDDSAATAPKRAPLSHSRPRGERRAATRSPPYEPLVDSDGDDETVDDELAARRTPSAPAFNREADWMDEMARTASRRTLLYRAGVLEESLNNLFRTLNDMEGHTMSLSAHEKTAQDGAAAIAAPAASPSKQHVHVTISDHKEANVGDEAKVSGAEAPASTKTTHRVSLSGTNVRKRSRSRPSASRLGVNGAAGRSPSADTSQTSGCGNNARKSASFTPTAMLGCGGALCGSGKANIMLNLPDGSSVLSSFPSSAYLDEVRWYTEELLARVLPTCFPFTMARTNPLREFEREDYRKTLEQLHLVPSATLLVLPRSAAQGECGAPALLSSGVNGEPVWLAIFRLVFGMFVATPLSLIWNLLNPQNDPSMAAAREAFLSGSLGSSTLSTLPPPGVATAATPLRSASSSRLCHRRPSSRTENFDIF